MSELERLSKHILELQKDKGELTDKVNELTEELKLTNNECKEMREELKQRIRENQKLCEQIEKMKLCQNCKYEFKDYMEIPCRNCIRCLGDIKRKGNSDKWEIKEK